MKHEEVKESLKELRKVGAFDLARTLEIYMSAFEELAFDASHAHDFQDDYCWADTENIMADYLEQASKEYKV